MERPVFYQGGGFTVSETLLRTPRKTYALGQIEYVSVQRPLVFFVGLPAAGLIGFSIGFWRYLLAAEAVTLTGLSVAAIIVSLRFGVLRVHSMALRDDDVAMNFGPIGRLRAVRAAVEQAMAFRDHREDAR
ncbi:hypothetical protein NBH19_08640 [Rhizobium sp. S95]|uniref:Uncharacterized protein n=1 Tax=Ciceribacter sichuanensis TaxID=2949647 RepID=A0AAJ1BWS7_9HYPH|nr:MULTISPECIES: hypothetical protein [unclassified Ciceribacter]MCM2396145.1 hypothetical protein [Ciceribacter sp. S95]MCO5957704.1 hypothetical protein [Ciceribacter sp. S101]